MLLLLFISIDAHYAWYKHICASNKIIGIYAIFKLVLLHVLLSFFGTAQSFLTIFRYGSLQKKKLHAFYKIWKIQKRI